MTKKEFENLPKKIKKRVKWGGKEYLLVKKGARGTVFLQPVDKIKLRPYPTSYESVELL